jgi:hypothetical protein
MRLVAGTSIERVMSARSRVRRYTNKSYIGKEFDMYRSRGTGSAWGSFGLSSGERISGCPRWNGVGTAEMLEASKLVAGRLIPQLRETPPENDPRASNRSAIHAFEGLAAWRKRLGSTLHGAASPMGARDRLGENGLLPGNRFFRPADMSALFKFGSA